MLAELLSSRAAVDDVRAPAAPGVYALFMRHSGRVGTFEVERDTPLYIGRSIDLAGRVWGNHFKSSSTGWSTLRRTLGTIMEDELALTAIPRGASRSKSNLRQYKFDPRGEEALTVWMRDHLDAGVCAVVHPEVVESELLTIVVPLLNLRDCPNPNATAIRRLRKRCADEAGGTVGV